MFIYCLVLCANQQIQSHKSMGLLIWESTANKCEITVWGINWRICEFWCYLFIYFFHIYQSLFFFFFVSGIYWWQKCLMKWIHLFCLFLCRGARGGEGEPNRDRANRKTETPAPPQRALPLPAVWESTCDTHQVQCTEAYKYIQKMDCTARQLKAVPMDSHSFSHESIHHTVRTSFVCVFIWCVLPPLSLSIRGKCSVALLNETEAVLSYLDKEVSLRGGNKLMSLSGFCYLKLHHRKSGHNLHAFSFLFFFLLLLLNSVASGSIQAFQICPCQLLNS